MTPRDFVYWLQGFAEINGSAVPTKEQWQIIQDHLKLVFDKQTPDRTVPTDVPGTPIINPITTPPVPFNPDTPWTITCKSEYDGKPDEDVHTLFCNAVKMVDNPVLC